jgi:hypothetical protein
MARIVMTGIVSEQLLANSGSELRIAAAQSVNRALKINLGAGHAG